MIVLIFIQVGMSYFIESKKQLFKISHVGLKSVSVGDIESDLPWSMKQANIIPINIEYNSSNRNSNKELLIEQISELVSIPKQIRKTGRTEKSLNKKICYGGVAPTPMLMLAGYCLSNMQEVVTADWDREKKKWYLNSGYDDGEALHLSEVPSSISDHQVINFCISLSYDVNMEHVKEEFPGIPIFEAKLDDIRLEGVRSLRKQNRISKEILEYISKVQRMYPRIKRINIFSAAQASFNYNFGTYLNQAHLPELVVYNYKNNNSDEEAKHNYGVILSDEKTPANMLIA